MPFAMMLFEFLTRKMWDALDSRKTNKLKALDKITNVINRE
jgi:hypothetical protein